VVDRLILDPEMRRILFPRDEADPAVALKAVTKTAHEVGFRLDESWSWDHTPVGELIAANLPQRSRRSRYRRAET
jgi:hypothetical protein